MESKMKIYKNCPAVDYTPKGRKEAYLCDIRIENKMLVLSYFQGAQIVWQGTEEAPGHYVCRIKGGNFDGEATLHGFPGGNILEGFWTIKSGVDATEGMWRITLKNLWREPSAGDRVAITTEEGELVQAKIDEVGSRCIKVNSFEDLLFSDYGVTWQYSD